MLSIRLARIGKKKQPSYRIVICQKHKDALGDYIENIGYLNYFGKEKTVELNKERVEYWLKNGAQPTASIHNLLVSQGILQADKKKPAGINSRKKKTETQEKEANSETGEKTAEAKPTNTETSNEKSEQTTEKAPADEKPAEPAKEENTEAQN